MNMNAMFAMSRTVVHPVDKKSKAYAVLLSESCTTMLKKYAPMYATPPAIPGPAQYTKNSMQVSIALQVILVSAESDFPACASVGPVVTPGSTAWAAGATIGAMLKSIAASTTAGIIIFSL